MLKAVARLLLPVAFAAFGVIGPALADGGDISTPAWTNHDLRLYTGPGNNFEVRTVLRGGIRVHVDRCSMLWCRIHAGRTSGYAFIYALSFGQGPNSNWAPAQVRHPGVDIYTGADVRNGWGWSWGRHTWR
jgi:uncharacterized protein YraI